MQTWMIMACSIMGQVKIHFRVYAKLAGPSSYFTFLSEDGRKHNKHILIIAQDHVINLYQNN